MRIVQVIANVAPRLGGPSRVVLEMSAALAARGHTVDVVTTSLAHRGSWIKQPSRLDLLPVETGKRMQRDGYHITFCKPSWPTVWGASYGMVRTLRDVIRRAEVVHIHSLYMFHTLLASRLARTHGVPYIIRPHGTLDPYIRRRHKILKAAYHLLLEDRTLRNAAAIHFTSEEERDLAMPALPRCARASIISLGVDVARFDNLPDRLLARRSLGVDQTALVWLFLGRLNHKKGLDLLAPAFAMFCQKVPGSWLIVAGPDDDGLGKRFLMECETAGVANRVTLTGFLDDLAIPRALAAADLWVLPSYSENFGRAVVEAMAARLPVLITDRINIWPAVKAAKAGVVTAANQEAVLQGMLHLAGLSPAGRAAMGQRGRELCERGYSWETVASKLTVLYRELVDLGSPAD